MKRVLMLVIAVILSVSVAGAGIDDTRALMIRNSPDYRWGEGYGESREEAREAAVRDLAQRIQTLIQAEQTRTTVETTTALQDTFSARTTFVSMIQLQGLDYFDLSGEGPGFHALAYITRDNLAASDRLQKDRIRALIAKAESERNSARLGEALRDAYWAYLLSHTVLDTMQLDLPADPRTGIRAILLEYLQTMLSELHFQAAPAVREDQSQLIPITVQYGNSPVHSLELSYYDGTGTAYSTISSGRGFLELSLSEPLPRRTAIKVKVEFAGEGSMVHDPQVESLHGVLRKRTIEQAWHTLEILIPFSEELVAEPAQIPVSTPGRGVDLPEPVPASREMQIIFPPIQESTLWPLTVTVLADIMDTPAFLDALDVYRRNGRLQFGNDPGVLRASGLDVYLAVTDSLRVHGLFQLDNSSYLDIRRDVRIDDPAAAFSGVGAYRIWIGIPDETH